MSDIQESYKEMFERVYTENYLRLYYYVLHIVNDEETTKDILNDVFVSLWKNIATFKEEKMTWGQYQVPQTSMKALKDGYYVKFIPSLVVIDPDGNIQLYTSSPDKAHHYLEEHIR